MGMVFRKQKGMLDLLAQKPHLIQGFLGLEEGSIMGFPLPFKSEQRAPKRICFFARKSVGNAFVRGVSQDQPNCRQTRPP